MFNKILFATCNLEACDPAARMAFDIAQKYNAHIYVFHVLGIPTHGYSQLVIDLTTGEEVTLDENYYDLVKEELSAYCDRVLKNTQKYSFEVTVGYPHREILRFARHINPDLIVMGGSTGDIDVSVYKKSITGSTFQRVAKVSSCPVLVVNRPAASFWNDFSNVVFGTDFSTAADAAFEFASRLVQELGCIFHLFHAIDITCNKMNKFYKNESIEKQTRKAKQKILNKYVPLLGEFKQYSVEVEKGIPSVEIVKYAGEKHADLIVLPYVAKKTKVDDTPLGNIVEQVIDRADCPVVSVNQYFV
jgi:nucleotide-binding universal stress UspA family protein